MMKIQLLQQFRLNRAGEECGRARPRRGGWGASGGASPPRRGWRRNAWLSRHDEPALVAV